MYYVYVIESLEDRRLYTGLTNNLKRRLSEHNTRQSGYTKKFAPFKLIFYEAYLNRKDAIVAEKFFKSGYGREVLKKDKLKNYFNIQKVYPPLRRMRR